MTFALLRERRPAGGPLGPVFPHFLEALPRFAHGELGGLQVLGETVALDLVVVHLAADALDFGLQGLELRLGLAGIRGALLGPGNRAGERRGDREGGEEGGDGRRGGAGSIQPQ